MEFPIFESLAGVLAIVYLVLLFTAVEARGISKTRRLVFIFLDIALLACNWLADNWLLFTIWLICLIFDSVKASDAR